MTILRRGPISEKVEWLFDLYDLIRNGEISSDEFVAIVECLKEVGKLHCNMNKMSDIYHKLDD